MQREVKGFTEREKQRFETHRLGTPWSLGALCVVRSSRWDAQGAAGRDPVKAALLHRGGPCSPARSSGFLLWSVKMRGAYESESDTL